jgi:hypothetical protein
MRTAAMKHGISLTHAASGNQRCRHRCYGIVRRRQQPQCRRTHIAQPPHSAAGTDEGYCGLSGRILGTQYILYGTGAGVMQQMP